MLLKLLGRGIIFSLGATLALTGCGGAGGGGNPGGPNNPPVDTTPQVGTAKFSVDVATGKVKVTPLNGDPKSRAIFSGTSLTFQSGDLLDDGGELTRRKIAVSMGNNTTERIGTPGKGFKVMFGDFKTLNGANTDLRLQTNVSTFIGSGAAGSEDGPNLGASLNIPMAVLVDNQGGVYISDASNQSLRVSRNGTLTTLIKNLGSVSAMVWKNGNPDTGIIYAVSTNHYRVYQLDVNAKTTSVVAGSGYNGNQDGPGGSARFTGPHSIAEIGSSSGSNPDFLVLDGIMGSLRRLTWNGSSYDVSTLGFSPSIGKSLVALGNDLFAATEMVTNKVVLFDLNGTKIYLGTGNSGYADGDGSSMEFYSPMTITKVMNSLYVTQGGGAPIRQLTLDPDANIRNPQSWRSATIAGSDNGFGFADGPGDQAMFFDAAGMAGDSSGNLLLADSSNNRIRQITPNNGRFPLSVGGGNSTTTEKVRLSNPTDFVPGGDGNEPTPYIQENQTVAPRVNAELTPWNLIVPEGVKHFEFTVTIEAETDSIAPPDAVSNPGPGVGNGSARAIVRTLAGATTAGFANGNVSAAAFASPTSFSYDAQGNLFIADAANHAVRRITPGGVVSTVAGTYGQAGANDGNGNEVRFSDVNGIVANAAGDVLYVTDTTNSTVRRISLVSGDPTVSGNWRVATIAGFAGAISYVNGKGGTARFNRPWGIALTTGGELIVSEASGNRLRKLRPVSGDLNLGGSWLVSLFAGDESAVSPTGGNADGTGTAALFNGPRGMALAPSGELYVADRDNHTIRKVSVAGVVSTIAGSTEGYGDSDTGSQAKFGLPNDVAVDRAGYIYVADTGNRVVRRVSPGGTVRTIAGGDSDGTADGPGNVARFKSINGIEVSNAGDVIVGDSTRLRLIERLISSGIVG